LLRADGKSNFRIPDHDSVAFTKKELPVPPYLVGALLGDAYLLGGVVLSVADRDLDILDRVKSLMPALNVKESRTGPSCVAYRLTLQDAPRGEFFKIIKQAGLAQYSADKFIPDNYLMSCTEDRIELLRGLMDTDGSCGVSGNVSPSGIHRYTGSVTFSSSSKTMAVQVAWLVRSLGGKATLSSFERGEKEVDHVVRMQVGFCPFYTAFKRDRWSAIANASAKITRAITKIEYVENTEQVCISVDAPDGLYLTDDFIVTHNTGAAIIAADYVLARTIFVLTTASGRAVWRKAFADWSSAGRTVKVLGVDKNAELADVTIASWGSAQNISNAHTKNRDLFILDEDHYGKSPEAKRTTSVYGKMYDGGTQMLVGGALLQPNVQAWHLTGTPMPHDPGDMYVRLRASAPEMLLENKEKGWPDVLRFEDFRKRYCIIRMKKLSAWNRIPVVIGGQNEAELSARIEGFWLRRLPSDVGMRPPSYETFPLLVSATQRRSANGDVDIEKVLSAAENGNTKELEMELGVLRRLTGKIKAEAVVGAIEEDFDNGLDKTVLMFWHTEVGNMLAEALAKFGVVFVDGSTPARERETAEIAFRTDPAKRVFIGQIQACCEAIDLSAASVLWFVETSFTPAHMAQASQRISNVKQTRNTFVRVCTIEGSIDDALQASLMRLWTAINKVIK